jgi:hypothetical protein
MGLHAIETQSKNERRLVHWLAIAESSGQRADLSIQQSATLAWALSQAAPSSSGPFFSALCSTSPPLSNADGSLASPDTVARLLWGCARSSGRWNNRFLWSIQVWLDGGDRLRSCTMPVVCILFWSFASLGHSPGARPSSLECLVIPCDARWWFPMLSDSVARSRKARGYRCGCRGGRTGAAGGRDGHRGPRCSGHNTLHVGRLPLVSRSSHRAQAAGRVRSAATFTAEQCTDRRAGTHCVRWWSRPWCVSLSPPLAQNCSSSLFSNACTSEPPGPSKAASQRRAGLVQL